MNPLPKIAESEWHVMKVLWEASPRTANAVVEALEGVVAWSPRTVKTLLNRLVNKEALGFRKEGRVYHYFPLIDESACVGAESRSFLQRVYGGALTPMLAQFIESEELSPEDVAQLRSVLDGKGRADR